MAKLNKKTFIYVGAGLATALVGYFAYDLLKTKSDQRKFSTSGNKSTGNNSGTTGASLGLGETSSASAEDSNDAYPIGVGQYGAKVWVLQEALKKLGQNITVDGKFGQNTYKAVNAISFGFGGGNILCGMNYGCKVSYNNWENIINKAKEKGFDVNQAWTNAKKKWKV